MESNRAYDFEQCLSQSHAASDLPFWEETYRKAFPNMEAMVDHRKDGEHQRAGIDRSIILDNAVQILVDEKVRGRNRKTGLVYEDIALEFISNDRFNTPGWVCKPLRCDYIAYAIAPVGRCYLLPVLQLQGAWRQCGNEWKERYGVRPVVNFGYRTLFTPVPVAVLYKAIGQMLRVTFTPHEIDD